MVRPPASPAELCGARPPERPGHAAAAYAPRGGQAGAPAVPRGKPAGAPVAPRGKPAGGRRGGRALLGNKKGAQTDKGWRMDSFQKTESLERAPSCRP